MPVIGFHASHEQVHPRALLAAAQRAQEVGFTAAMCSDHFAPWSERQGQSGYAWSWLGAALATTSMPYGVVCAPGQRYHPAIVAQAVATLGAMFPGRFWVALGSGEAVNEHITGDDWPRKVVRDARLRECVEILRTLLAGDEVSWDGLVKVDRARVWTLPDVTPLLIGAAVSVETAESVAGWADGLITVRQPIAHLRKMIDVYRAAGGRGALHLQVHLAWDPDEDVALGIAHDQWRNGVLPAELAWDLETVEQFDAATQHVPAKSLRDCVLVSSDLGQHTAWLHELLDVGFDELYLHHVGRDQDAFLDAFGADVLPQLSLTSPVATS